MEAILLVDDDPDAQEAVRLALEPEVYVHIAAELHEALRFLRTRADEIAGVNVDRNLTEGSDYFGREVLTELRAMEKPCVVFSQGVTTADQARRYEIEFGVLGAIGKGGGLASVEPLDQLRAKVSEIIRVSLEQVRESVLEEVIAGFAQQEADIDAEKRSSEDVIARLREVSGRSAASRMSKSEGLRLAGLRADLDELRARVSGLVAVAGSVEELSKIREDAREGTLGVL